MVPRLPVLPRYKGSKALLNQWKEREDGWVVDMFLCFLGHQWDRYWQIWYQHVSTYMSMYKLYIDISIHYIYICEFVLALIIVQRLQAMSWIFPMCKARKKTCLSRSGTSAGEEDSSCLYTEKDTLWLEDSMDFMVVYTIW